MKALSLCVGLLALASLAGFVDDAKACTCAFADPWTSLEQSDAAFVGRLVSERDAPGGYVEMTFSVERVVTGRPPGVWAGRTLRATALRSGPVANRSRLPGR